MDSDSENQQGDDRKSDNDKRKEDERDKNDRNDRKKTPVADKESNQHTDARNSGIGREGNNKSTTDDLQKTSNSESCKSSFSGHGFGNLFSGEKPLSQAKDPFDFSKISQSGGAFVLGSGFVNFGQEKFPDTNTEPSSTEHKTESKGDKITQNTHIHNNGEATSTNIWIMPQDTAGFAGSESQKCLPAIGSKHAPEASMAGLTPLTSESKGTTSLVMPVPETRRHRAPNSSISNARRGRGTAFKRSDDSIVQTVPGAGIHSARHADSRFSKTPARSASQLPQPPSTPKGLGSYQSFHSQPSTFPDQASGEGTQDDESLGANDKDIIGQGPRHSTPVVNKSKKEDASDNLNVSRIPSSQFSDSVAEANGNNSPKSQGEKKEGNSAETPAAQQSNAQASSLSQRGDTLSNLTDSTAEKHDETPTASPPTDSDNESFNGSLNEEPTRHPNSSATFGDDLTDGKQNNESSAIEVSNNDTGIGSSAMSDRSGGQVLGMGSSSGGPETEMQKMGAAFDVGTMKQALQDVLLHHKAENDTREKELQAKILQMQAQVDKLQNMNEQLKDLPKMVESLKTKSSQQTETINKQNNDIGQLRGEQERLVRCNQERDEQLSQSRQEYQELETRTAREKQQLNSQLKELETESRDQISRLTEERDSVTAENNSLNESNSELTEQTTVLKQEKAALESEKQQMNLNITQQKLQLNKLEAESRDQISRLTQQRNSVTAERNSLSESYSQLTEQTTVLKQEKAALETERKRLKSALDQEQRNTYGLSATISRQELQLQEKDQLQRSLRERDEQLSQSRRECRDLQTNVADTKDQLEALQTMFTNNVEAHKHEKLKLNSDIMRLKLQLNELEAQSRDQISRLTQQKDSLTAERNSLNESCSELREQIEVLEQERASLESELSEAERRRHEMETEVQVLAKQKQAAQDQAKTLGEQLTLHQLEVAKLQACVQKKQREEQELVVREQRMTVMEVQAAQATLEINQLSNQLTVRDQEKTRLDTVVTGLKDTLLNMEFKIRDAQSKEEQARIEMGNNEELKLRYLKEAKITKDQQKLLLDEMKRLKNQIRVQKEELESLRESLDRCRWHQRPL